MRSRYLNEKTLSIMVSEMTIGGSELKYRSEGEEKRTCILFFSS